MEFLPNLAVEKLLTYLDVKDLLACSLVSVGWRSSVNKDCAWKRVCYAQCGGVTIDYLQTVPSKITPLFERADEANGSLEPLCFWRIVYMKLWHVRCNWCRGNYKTYKVTEFAFAHFDLRVDNKFLIASVNDNTVEVWNIKNRPKKQEIIVCALKNAQCKCMIHISDDKIVIVQDTLLQIYHFVDKKFVLIYRRVFNKNESFSENIPSSLNIDEWYESNIEKRPTHLQAFHVGKYFIGLAKNEGSFRKASFHIWDTISGSKLIEEPVERFCLNLQDSVRNVLFCPPKSCVNNVLICFQCSSRIAVDGITYYTVMYMYNLKNLTFKKLMVLEPPCPWIYFEDNFIVTVDHCRKHLNVYSSSNGQKLMFQQKSCINTDSVQIHRDLLGFTAGGELIVWNLKDIKIVFKTDIVKASSYLFGFDFVFLDWHLILICRWDDDVNKIEVWSVDQKCLVRTLNTSGLLFPCNNSAKFFIWDEMVTTIYMLQFW